MRILGKVIMVSNSGFVTGSQSIGQSSSSDVPMLVGYSDGIIIHVYGCSTYGLRHGWVCKSMFAWCF